MIFSFIRGLLNEEDTTEGLPVGEGIKSAHLLIQEEC